MEYSPLCTMNSAAFGGGEENRFPMWTSVSSLIPVADIFKGSFPSKNPDHGESSQSLYLMCVSWRAAAWASSQIFSYLSLTSWENWFIDKFVEVLFQFQKLCLEHKSSKFSRNQTFTSSGVTTPSSISFSAYLSRAGLVFLILRYIRGWVNMGSSTSLWPLRR